ncbi:putative C6 transcription factor [Aspergillus lucknowensis]|uniref:Zn(2)-C6 fungal-type domain-containing protein n=1 Tax=Aspergillus lucknowensis TaxID=176173 RepID=A0ABR4LYE8_9EURO
MTESAAAVRRNGLLQSCEPCRKSKLKCDHGRPVCGRCIAKNRIQVCFYHPAPMTKQGGPGPAGPVKRPRLESSEYSASTADYPGLRVTSEPPSANPGYLGSTSFSAVLTEHRTDISFEEDSAATGGVLVKPIDRFRLQSGLEVLKFLHRSTICDTLIRKFYAGHLMAVVSNIVMEAILKSLRRVFDSLDSSQNLETQLQDLVSQIFRSSAHPLTSHSSMTVEEYCGMFTGKNLRWEAVGIVLATSGIAMMSTADTDPDFSRVAPDAQARDMLRAQVIEASNICLGFCDTPASVNELLGFYQYNDMLLRTQYYGDTSYLAWRRLGSLTATIYAAGLHQESTGAQDCPAFLHQWRKGCFASAFYADKCLSTFVGRPPFINYRYCALSPPMDLSDEELIAGGERLSQAISNLDAAGWNPRGNDLRVSMKRLRFLLAVLREQALEIALGTFDDTDILRKYNEVIETAQETWNACPSHLRYDRHIKTDRDPTSITFARRHIYLDYLYTLFLVQRMVVKRTNTGHEALFSTSREVLSLIIEMTGDRDMTEDTSIHQSWIALYYGLPSASILAFELLRQTKEPGPHPVMPPRAELIRNLSIFVSCLSWAARPGQGNYRTCKAVEKKLSDILDQILDPQPSQRELLDGDNNGLYSLLSWYSPDNWEFDPFELPSKDGFPF